MRASLTGSGAPASRPTSSAQKCVQLLYSRLYVLLLYLSAPRPCTMAKRVGAGTAVVLQGVMGNKVVRQGRVRRVRRDVPCHTTELCLSVV